MEFRDYKSGEDEYNTNTTIRYLYYYILQMKLTKLQQDSNIYIQMYAEVYKRTRKICRNLDDGDRLLVARFNEVQAEYEEFKKSLLELFYQGKNILA